MSVKHSTLTGSELHEPKGADSAVAGQYLAAVGDGTSEFKSVSYDDIDGAPDLSKILTLEIETTSNTAQAPSAVDTLKQVTLSAKSTSNIAISSNGDITFSNAGTYLVKFWGLFGRESGTSGIANVLLLAQVNQSQIDHTKLIALDNAANSVPVEMEILHTAAQGEILNFHLLQDSTGIAEGGLVAFTPADTSVDQVPAALVKIYKVGN